MLGENGFEPASRDDKNIKLEMEIKEVIRIIEKLEPDYREVVMMRHVEGMSVKEIAAIIGESENLISVRIHRGLTKVRELLK
jgi:RNA polymerase sigma-70 factor (ECF subfamily)